MWRMSLSVCEYVCVGRRFLSRSRSDPNHKRQPCLDYSTALKLPSNSTTLHSEPTLKKWGAPYIRSGGFNIWKHGKRELTSELAPKCRSSVLRCENGLLQKLWLRMTQMTGSRILSVYYKQTGCRRPWAGLPWGWWIAERQRALESDSADLDSPHKIATERSCAHKAGKSTL